MIVDVVQGLVNCLSHLGTSRRVGLPSLFLLKFEKSLRRIVRNGHPLKFQSMLIVANDHIHEMYKIINRTALYLEIISANPYAYQKIGGLTSKP